MNQPQNKYFKHSIIAALVISLSGISFASFADTVAVPTTATSTTTASAPSAEDHAARKASWEADRAEHKQDRTQRRTEEFNKADTNHDGQLTLEEWLAFKPHHHHHHGFWQRFAFWHHHGHRGQRPEAWFNKVDTNHDGSISLSEAQAGAPEMAKHFNEIDTDHNGQISQDELHAYFQTKHEKSQS
jgi:Ca2+-binding EF-hand superfamily protein